MSAIEGDLKVNFEKFVDDLRQERILGSCLIATTTVRLLKDIVLLEDKWRTAKELIQIIRQEGRKLTIAQPSETVVGNMVKRILKIIREDYEELKHEGSDIAYVSDIERETDDYNTYLPKLRDIINDSLTELLEELDKSANSIACEALKHIHASEVVMTIGKSNTVEQFLKAAAKKRKFQVVVAECAPFYHGQELAVSLAKVNIETTVITDSAVFAMMSRVNKVIIGTHSVLANGGLKAVNGSYAVALAAKTYSVPLIVCTAVYKLSPQHLCTIDQDAFNKFASPHSVLNFNEGKILSNSLVYNPVFDYVPPELVNLFIFNIGGNAPSYIYRLLSEMYHSDDYHLEDDKLSC